MKSMYLVIGLIIIALIAFLVFRPKGEVLSPSEQEITDPVTLRDDLVLVNSVTDGEYMADPGSSQIEWTGSMAITNAKNIGVVKVQQGSLSASGGSITAGEIVMDMNSVSSTDTIFSRTNDPKLDEHLKSEDFFNVEAFPTSTLILKSVTLRSDLGDGKYDVVADLTIKDITNEIQFPAEILEVDDILVIRGNIEMDRTLWGITFRSGKFFDDLGDTALSDTILIDVELVATAGRG